MTRIVTAYLPAAAWAAFVFYVGGHPDLRPPRMLDFPGADKLAHFAMYGVMSGLALLGRHLARLRHTAWWALLVIVLLAAADEARQGAVPGRSPDVADWLADVAGAGAVVLVGWTMGRSKERSDRHES